MRRGLHQHDAGGRHRFWRVTIALCSVIVIAASALIRIHGRLSVDIITALSGV